MRKRGKPPNLKALPGYVRYTEAVNLFLPHDKNAFNYRVRAGDIKTEKDAAGRMYEVTSIIAMKEALLKEISKGKTPDTIVDWLTADDIIAALELDKLVYDDFLLGEAVVYQDWKKKNPHTSLAVYDAKDRRICYAYIALIPLKEQTIINVLLGKRNELDLREDDILSYDTPGEYYLLANSAVHHPDYPELINKLLEAIMNFWIDQYPRVRLKRIYAQTVSDSGRIMVKKLFLGPIYIITTDGHLERIKDAFVLDMDEPSASKVIQRFREKINSKKDQSESHKA